jgi:2-haloacid dehalogenase
MQAIKNVIFDLGGVLIDWDPKRLYRKIFNSEQEIDFFLENICTPDWNELQDGGRPLKEATATLLTQHPQYQQEIEAFYGRWEEMLGGVMEATATLARRVQQNGPHKLYALTNWSAETFPIAEERYDILNLFDGILVSGKENLKKPDPRIYQLLLKRYGLKAKQCFFIDDNLRNISAAKALGINAIQFTHANELEAVLKRYNIL